MTNRFIIPIIFLFAFSSCHMEDKDVARSKIHTIKASIGAQTKTLLIQKEGTKDMWTRWQGHEYLKVYLQQDDEYNKSVPVVQVSEVLNDGHNAIFTYKVPEEWEESDSYDVKLFTTTCNPVVSNNKLYYNASLIRESIETFMVPVYSEGTVSGDGEVNAEFHHYYTYELLHIKNASSTPIQFSLSGFNAQSTWYREKGSFCLEDESFVVDAPSTRNPITENAAITIGPGETKVIVSAYVPTGYLVKDATIVAKINGQSVQSANKITSGVNIHQAHAYHMYATWDGSLFFTNASGDIIKSSEVDAGGSGFDPIEEGNMYGYGSGYQSDGSGDISSGGSGYNGGDSGALSGSGNGYSSD